MIDHGLENTMKKTDKGIILSLLIPILIIIAAFFLLEQFYYENPLVEIHIASNAVKNIDKMNISIEERSIFGVSDKAADKVMSAYARIKEIYEQIELECDSDRSIKVDVKDGHNKTIIFIDAKGKKGDESVKINEAVTISLRTRTIRE